MAQFKTKNNKGEDVYVTGVMSADPQTGTTVYTMDDMNRDIAIRNSVLGKFASNLEKGINNTFNSDPNYNGWDYLLGNKSFATNKNKNVTLDPIDVSDLLNEYNNMYSSYGSGGGGMTNLSNIFASLEQGAETQKQVAKDTYNTRREDLLRDLERFQEENKRNVQNQQRAYLSNQASIESAIAQADRQNRISAAARGLGGSGLQQLAQLQNLLSQGQTISDMASENQSAMDNLRRLLAQKEEDTATANERALTDYNNTLMEIASNLAMNKSNYEYQASENALNRAANAANYRAAQEYEDNKTARGLSQAITAEQESLQNTLKDIMNSKKATDVYNPYTKEKFTTKNKSQAMEEAYRSATSNIRNLLYSAGIDTSSNTSKTALNNLLDLYNEYN